MNMSNPTQPARHRNPDIERKLHAAEQRRLHDDSTPPHRSSTQNAAIARKLRRAQGTQNGQPPSAKNERRELEQIERAHRLQAGGSSYRELLIRIGLGGVDMATLLIIGFSVLTMLVIPLLVIVTS